MKIKLLTLSLLPLMALSQSNRPVDGSDSAAYYQIQMKKMTRRALDSLQKTEAYAIARSGYLRSLKNSGNYGGFVLFSGIMHSGFTKLNNDLAQSGFPKIHPIAAGFGMGISFQEDRTVVDFYFMNAFFGSDSKKGDEKVDFQMGDIFSLDFGYDLLKPINISLYPYLGLGGRVSTITYSKPRQLNPGFSSINNFVLNDQSVNMSSGRLGYHAGMGLDIVLGENRSHSTSKIIFVKGGIDRPIWKDKYKLEGVVYDAAVKTDWLLNFGIKFAIKH